MNLSDFNQGTLQTKYKPVSPWAYWGCMLLACIPFVNIIALLILAFAPERVNLKNYARGHILISIISIVLLIIFLPVLEPMLEEMGVNVNFYFDI